MGGAIMSIFDVIEEQQKVKSIEPVSLEQVPLEVRDKVNSALKKGENFNIPYEPQQQPESKTGNVFDKIHTVSLEKSWTDVGKEAIMNVPESAYNFGKNIYLAFRHPIESVKSVGKLAKGGVETLIPGEQGEDEKFARQFGSFMVDRYGSVEGFKKTLAQDPIGVAADVSTVLGGVGIGVSVAGKTAQVGNLAKVAGVLQKASSVAKTASKYTNPMSAVTGSLKGIGSISEANALKLVKSAVSFSDKVGYERIDTLSNAILSSGFNVKPSFLGKINNKLKNVQTKINGIIDKKTSTGYKIKTTEITNAIDDLINNPDELQKAGLMFDDIKALESMRDQVISLNGAEVTPKTLQAIKVGMNKAFKSDLNEKWGLANKKAVDILRQSAKKKLEEIAPQLKSLNQKEGIMLELQDAIEKRLITYQRRSPIPIKGFTLGTVAGGAVGYSTGSIGQAAAVAGTAIVLDKIIESPSIQIKLAKAIHYANIGMASKGKLLEHLPTKPAFQAGRIFNYKPDTGEFNEAAE